MKKNLTDWLKQWDSGEFDFSEQTPPERTGTEYPEDHRWIDDTLSGLEDRQFRAFGRFFPAAAALLGAVMIIFLLSAVIYMPAFGDPSSPAALSPVTERYNEKALEETGAVNVVAGVILDYRAFDTLGESHVLFTAACAVFILMLAEKRDEPRSFERDILLKDNILKITARVLMPVILLFGIYIMLNGHLGPGGGFCGGAVCGGGLILGNLAFGPAVMERIMDMKTYRRTVIGALLFYSLAKCYSFFCGANGLETVFKTGTPGAIFSAGLILPLNIAVGLVVTCTMYGFYCVFTGGKL